MRGDVYSALAGCYDRLTEDVPYETFADFYENRLKGAKNRTLLDLCCGTGTLTCLLAGRGYEMIGVDASPEMLAMAAEKAKEGRFAAAPLFLCQEAAALDLYGTVGGALCSLDAVNYLPGEELPEVFRRLRLFIEPGGVFAFDLRKPAFLRGLDGQAFVDEGEDFLCLWRAAFDAEENALAYGLDLFRRDGKLWRREREEHTQYAHEPEALAALLRRAGFGRIEILPGDLVSDRGRVFIVAENIGA